jgi:hypothetical protein
MDYTCRWRALSYAGGLISSEYDVNQKEPVAMLEILMF